MVSSDGKTSDATESDIRYFAAYDFPAVLSCSGAWDALRDVYFLLARDKLWNVRVTIASSLHCVASLIGPKRSEEELVPVFDSYLTKDLEEVKMGVVKNMAAFLSVLPQEKREGYGKQIIETAKDINWRMRILIAEYALFYFF